MQRHPVSRIVTTSTSWRGTVVNTGYSCYLTAARRRRAQFLFFLVDLGPGAAVCGMRIETNTGYSCNLTAARSRQGQFLSLVDLGLGAPTDRFCDLGCGFLPILGLLIAFFCAWDSVRLIFSPGARRPAVLTTLGFGVCLICHLVELKELKSSNKGYFFYLSLAN